jgi:hypothetical protein
MAYALHLSCIERAAARAQPGAASWSSRKAGVGAMRKLVKIYGERNTNTNYLAKLIALNLDATQIPGTVPNGIDRLAQVLPGNELIRDCYHKLAYAKTLGWKHTRVKPLSELRRYSLVTDGTALITITKNPYSWLLSLYEHPYHQYYSHKPDFEGFLTTPWKTVRRDNVPASSLTPVELWNVKNRSYVQSDDDCLLNLTSEGILKDPEQVIRTISRRYGIPLKTGRFTNYEKSTKEPGKSNGWYRSYYLSEQWREQLSSRAIAIINDSIDTDLMAYFDYPVLPTRRVRAAKSG